MSKKILNTSLFFLPAIFLFSACTMQSEAEIQKKIDEVVAQKEKEIRAEVDLEKKDFLFEKSQECLKNDIDIPEYTTLGDEIFLDTTFYSPKTNTCLYTIIKYFVDSDGAIKRHELFNSDSEWSIQTPIIVCNEAMTGYTQSDSNKYSIDEFPCDEFDEKIETYYKTF